MKIPTKPLIKLNGGPSFTTNCDVIKNDVETTTLMKIKILLIN